MGTHTIRESFLTPSLSAHYGQISVFFGRNFSLDGGDGDDTLDGGDGSDTLDGEGGDDSGTVDSTAAAMQARPSVLT